MKKLIRIVLAITMLVAGLMFALPASQASASPEPSSLLTYSYRIYAPDPLHPGVTGTFRCPSGYRVVNAGAGNAQILAESPDQSFTTVTVVAAAYQPAPSNFAYVELTCAPASQFTDVKYSTTGDQSLKSGVFRREVTWCPAGMYAFGGGGYFSYAGGGGFLGAGYNNVSNSPTADGTGWTYSGIVPANQAELHVFSQCAPKVGRDLLMQAGILSQDANSYVSGYATCPAGYTAISGGFYISNPDGSEATPGNVIWSVPATNGPASQAGTNDSWYVAGTAPVNTKVVALAQCVR